MDTSPPPHIRQIWNQVELIKKLSDRIVGIGPFGIGLDGLLAIVPGANLIYGLSAGGLLLVHAVRAQAHPLTMVRMAAYLAFDNASDVVPFVGWAVDALFPGHLMAAKALQKDIVKRHGPMTEPKSSDKPRKVGQASVAGR
ncbi:DUF4112 domain-containing protein [soil metagenome]